MGDTFHDPIDHARTTRRHAGESLINVRSWPGHLLIVIAVLAIFRSLTMFGEGLSERGMISGVIAMVALASGVMWLVVEQRRILGIENRWHEAHPDVIRQRPAG